MSEAGRQLRRLGGRRAGVLAVIGVLAVVVTVLFLRMFVSATEDLEGRRAYLANDTLGALRHYDLALRWGAPPRRTQLRQAETLLLRLEQADLGIRGTMAGSIEEMTTHTRTLVENLLRDAPRRAYFWSLYAGLAQRDARVARRRTVLDLSRISENPLENLGPDDWKAVGSLQVAASLEPNNALYQDMLAEAFLDAGAEEAALPHVRGALRGLPVYAAHPFLDRYPIPDPILDGAIQGYDDALREGSLIGTTLVRCDAGEFLLHNGQAARALPYLKAALDASPGSGVTQYLMGQAKFQMADYRGAIPHLESAVTHGYADLPGPQFLLGRCHEELGELDRAVDAYREARLVEPDGLRSFYALGGALEKLGRLEEAERQFIAATNYHPLEASAWVELIEYQRRHEDVSGERQACDRLLALRPEDKGYEQLCARATGDAS